jgi:cleavage and polyadenylation specificity factor subunit 1
VQIKLVTRDSACNPDPTMQLALVTDASTTSIGTVLQQRVNKVWQPLAFFSRKLNSTQRKYSAYDRELLAVYEAIRYFRHMLEARHFTVFTDHKPLIYAFQQKPDKCSPRQFNHLDFISQFTTDIRHISGQDNIVADALSHVDSVTAPPSFQALAIAQDSDKELQTKHFWLPTRPSGSRNNTSPAPHSTSTVIRLPGNLGHTFQLHYDTKCSSPPTICRIQVQEQRPS